MDAPTLARRASVAALLMAGIGLATDAGWIHTKAAFAQHLLHLAWNDSDQGATARKPWPWADTHPVARLRAPTLGIDQIVLAGDSGRTLAFGPGWAEASAVPGARGTSVISGHRDTHFAFLRDMGTGMEVEVENSGARRTYRVVGTRIVDVRTDLIALRGHDALLLVTCYPFDAVSAGGPLRYVVELRPQSDARAPSHGAGGAPHPGLRTS